MRGTFNKVPRRAAASQRVNRGRCADVLILEAVLILKAVLAGHLNEPAFAKIFFAPGALGPAYPNERLQFILADGRDQASIGSELLEQGARNSGHRCRHQYRVERRHLRPSLGTVGALEEHFRDTHRIQDYARTVLQPLDT